MEKIRYVNSVSRLCLHLRDVALKLNLSFDMCRWLVVGDDVEVIHEVLVRHHWLLTSRPLLRSSGLQLLPLHRLAQLGGREVRVTSRDSGPIILLRSWEEEIRWWWTIGLCRWRRYWRRWRLPPIRPGSN